MENVSHESYMLAKLLSFKINSKAHILRGEVKEIMSIGMIKFLFLLTVYFDQLTNITYIEILDDTLIPFKLVGLSTGGVICI